MSTGIEAPPRSSETGCAARNLPKLDFRGAMGPREQAPQGEFDSFWSSVFRVSGADPQTCCKPRYRLVAPRVHLPRLRCAMLASMAQGSIATRWADRLRSGVRVPWRARRLAGAVRDCLPDAHSGFGIPRQIASSGRSRGSASSMRTPSTASRTSSGGSVSRGCGFAVAQGLRRHRRSARVRCPHSTRRAAPSVQRGSVTLITSDRIRATLSGN
jgi:hypothetical protein